MVTLGQQLKAAREAKGVTEFEAGSATRILTKLIVKMEADDFSEMAAPTYAKGFIRLYATYLGLDPEPLVNEYIETYVPKEKALTEQKLQHHTQKPIEFNSFAVVSAMFFSKIWKKHPKFDVRMLAIGATALLILGVLIASFSSRCVPYPTAITEPPIPDAAYQLLNEPLPDLYLVELGKIEGIQ